MNVNDIKNVPDTLNYLDAIFTRQKELMEKYGPIEHSVLHIDKLNVMNGSIDDPVFQLKIKEHLWRVIEEVAESYEVYLEESINYGHQMEELADALHFLVETMILVGISHNSIRPIEIIFDDFDRINWSVGECYADVFFHIGIVGNCLKNKPWKRTQMRTDRDKFISCMKKAYESLIILFFFLGFPPCDIYNIYFRKSEVNLFRQRSHY